MGLLGGLFGGSSKSSSTSSAQTDNRRVLGDGAVSMELAGNSSLTQNTTLTDFGAIQAAQRIAQESAAAGSEVARASLAGAFNFGADAVGLSADALGMGGKALTDALDFSSNAFGVVDSVVSNAIEVIARRADEESGAMMSVYRSALDQMGVTNSRLGDAYADSQGRGAKTDVMLMMAIAGAVLIAVAAGRGKG